jgi:hypothetical protein
MTHSQPAYCSDLYSNLDSYSHKGPSLSQADSNRWVRRLLSETRDRMPHSVSSWSAGIDRLSTELLPRQRRRGFRKSILEVH